MFALPRRPSIRLLLSFGTLSAVLLLPVYASGFATALQVLLARIRYRSAGLLGFSDPHKTLGIASNIYVISLPRRTDRRRDMERIRLLLGLRWTYVDAIDTEDEAVGSILHHVEMQRLAMVNQTSAQNATNLDFRWPQDANYQTREPPQPAGTDLWALPPQDVLPDPSPSSSPLSQRHLMACATEDFNVTEYMPSLPPHMVLSPAKIAVWHSHVSLIHKIANNGLYDHESGEASLILEDDVDMEWDIHSRLADVWSALPEDWDIVFLGHCWSNEAYYQPLSGSFWSSTLIHPSKAPKCTHAYALSTRGARRLLYHLRYPPFAYSRALDQAFAWLIQSGRLKSFSIVPSVVVQRKIGPSDVWSSTDGTQGNGSSWRDQLMNGVLGSR